MSSSKTDLKEKLARLKLKNKKEKEERETKPKDPLPSSIESRKREEDDDAPSTPTIETAERAKSAKKSDLEESGGSETREALSPISLKEPKPKEEGDNEPQSLPKYSAETLSRMAMLKERKEKLKKELKEISQSSLSRPPAEIDKPVVSERKGKEEDEVERVKDTVPSSARLEMLKRKAAEARKALEISEQRKSETDQKLKSLLDQERTVHKMAHDLDKRDERASELLQEAEEDTRAIDAAKKRKADLLALKKKAIEEDKAKPSLSVLEAKHQKVSAELDGRVYGVEVVFVMDCTGSMEPFWRECRDKVEMIAMKTYEMMNEKAHRKTAKIFVGFVAYRDFLFQDRKYEVPEGMSVKDFERVQDRASQDQFPQLEKSDLYVQERIGELKAWIGRLKLGGGYDCAEDVVSGLEAAIDYPWKTSTRVVIHVCDAPPHGRDWHDGVDDDFPDGDPRGRSLEGVMKALKSKFVHYVLLSVNGKTDRMFSRIQEVMTPNICLKLPISSEARDFLPQTIYGLTQALKSQINF